MHRKVTAVELAGIEGFTHVVNDGVGLASFPVVILSAILPHAWALVQGIVACSIFFVQDKNCGVFTVVESMSFTTAVGTLVLRICGFLPLINVNIMIIAIRLSLLHFLDCLSFVCGAYFKIFWRYWSSIGVFHFLVYIFVPILAEGLDSLCFLHEFGNITESSNIINQFSSVSLTLILPHASIFFVQVLEPMAFCLIMVIKIFNLSLEVLDAIMWLTIDLLDVTVFTKLVSF